MKEVTCGQIFNKLLFHAAAVKYIELTNKYKCQGGGLLYPDPELIRVKYGKQEQTTSI